MDCVMGMIWVMLWGLVLLFEYNYHCKGIMRKGF